MVVQVTVWDQHASIDPYGAAVGQVGDGPRRWANRAEFRRTGEAEIERYLPAGIRFRRCLDLGCGPGRHLAALGARAESVVGFDPCAAMRIEAACAVRSLPNVAIVGDEATLVGRGPFDLIWCRLVLQHQRSEQLSVEVLDRIASVLAPDGIVVVQVVHARTDRLRRVRRAFGGVRWRVTQRRLPRLPMTALGEAAFSRWLEGNRLRAVVADEDGGARGWLSRTYVLERGTMAVARAS